MSAAQWENLLWGLYAVFGPLVWWWLVLAVVSAFLTAGWLIWLGLLAWLTQQHEGR